MNDEHQDEQHNDQQQDGNQNDVANAAGDTPPNGNATGRTATPGMVSRILGAPLSIGNALVLLVILGAIVVLVTLAIGPTREGTQTGIDNAEYARGLITLIFSGGTMLIAVLLALYVITSESPIADERFTRGKEVLTILIGVFGTILGFYFGKSDVVPSSPAPTRQNAPAENNPTTAPTSDPNANNESRPESNSGGAS